MLLVLFFCASAAHAQATRTWVSGVGDDVNPCSRTAPCKTFAGAISKTAAGGEINCIDPGGFGALTITKAITIDCSYTEGGVLVAGSNGINVNAGANDVVTLRGLDFFGAVAPNAVATNGIVFNSGAALIVERCTIRQFQAQSPFPIGFGILFKPSAAAKLHVADTYISNNGAGSAGGAIIIRPSGSAVVKATVSHVVAQNNITGITVDGSVSTGTIFLDVNNTVSTGNAFTGISIVTPAAGGASVFAMVDRTSITNSATGINSSGAKSNVLLSNSTVTGDGTGLAASGGGKILSYTNNYVDGSNIDGAPTGNITPK